MDYQKLVQNALDRAVEEGIECGCQAAVYLDGKLVANAYSGWTDWTKSKKVDENTVFPIYSTGKAISSTVLHKLVEMGKLSYDTRISDIWKEFGCNGKEDMRVWHVMSYRAAMYQVPTLNADGMPITDEELADFDYMTNLMAKSTPAEIFGANQKYHPLTYGWLTGGIACHALGRNDYPQIFRELVGDPAGMDRFFYGISKDEENTVTLVPGLDGSCCSETGVANMNKNVFRRCCDPSARAMSNALSIARHYAALDQGKLLKQETIDNAIDTKWRAADDHFDRIKGRWDIFGLGYVLSGPVDDITRIFGHGGLGGSEGILDRKSRLAFGFTRNCFIDKSALSYIYDAINFKNRDWPDPAEVPELLKEKSL